MSEHRIKVSFESSNTVEESFGVQGRLVATAYDAENMPLEIFLFSQEVLNPLENTTKDIFEGVCTATNLTFYPSVEYNPNYTYFRKATADIIIPNVGSLPAIKESIEAAILQLCDELDRLSETGELSDIWYPSAPAGSSSSSPAGDTEEPRYIGLPAIAIISTPHDEQIYLLWDAEEEEWTNDGMVLSHLYRIYRSEGYWVLENTNEDLTFQLATEDENPFGWVWPAGYAVIAYAYSPDLYVPEVE